MQLQHTDARSDAERRYDTETLSKVVGLAERLQREKDDRLSAREIETIGAEVGLEPSFIQQALAQLTRKEVRQEPRPIRRNDLKAIVAGWWAAGWAVPMTTLMLGCRGIGRSFA